MWHFKHLVIIAMGLLSIQLSAQDSLRMYFNRFGQKVNSGYASSYRDLVRDSSGVYRGTEYYISGKVKETSNYVKGLIDFYAVGPYVSYYPNGNKSSEGMFVIDTHTVASVKTGKWKNYYMNGRVKEETAHVIKTDGSGKEWFVMNYWDTAGQQLVIKGNGRYTYSKTVVADSVLHIAACTGELQKGRRHGTWTTVLHTGQIHSEEVFAEGHFVSGKIFSKKKVVLAYDTLNRPAMFNEENDLAELVRMVYQNIEYPQMERDNDIQGTVLIQFTVYEDGSLNDFTVYKSVSLGLDVEALRAVSQLPKFSPKLVNGKPVKGEFLFPVTFKLI